MGNLYYIGQDLLYFAVALLGTQIIMWIAGKLIKDKEKKINFKTSWYNLIFSILFLLLYPQVGVILTVFNLLVLLFGIRFTVLKDKKVSDWGTGIIFILITVLNIFNGEYDKEWEFAIVGIAWLLFRFVIQKEKFWKFSKMGFFTLLSMIIGFIVYLLKFLPLSYNLIVPLQILATIIFGWIVNRIINLEEYCEIKNIVLTVIKKYGKKFNH